MNTLRYTYKFIDGNWKLQGGDVSGADEKNGWWLPTWPTSDTEWTEYQKEKAHFCQHKWVDTGMRKTFCKECDIDGDYDPMTGQVTVIWKEKKNGQQKETK